MVRAIMAALAPTLALAEAVSAVSDAQDFCSSGAAIVIAVGPIRQG